jgi:hypothetical protein
VKIRLRVRFEDATRAELSRDPLLAPVLHDDRKVFVWFDAESRAFDRVIERTKDTSGFWYTPDFVFETKDLRNSTCFTLGCQRIVWETEPDQEYNQTRLAQAAWVRTGDRSGYKLLSRLALSRINIGRMEIGSIGEWTEEWVARVETAGLLRAELRGLSTTPLYDSERGQFHTAFAQLVTTGTMPLSVKDATVIVTQADEQGMPLFRLLGCVVYEDSAMGNTDFARTSEGWGAHGQPLWVASDRVRKWAQENRVKGWRFRPVLAKGSPAHEQYLGLWRTLQQKTSANPENRLW